MKALAALIARNEDVLMAQVCAYAVEHGYIRYNAILEGVWRASVREYLSGTLKTVPCLSEILDTWLDDVVRDHPLSSYGITEGRRHRGRSIPIGMFLGLFKSYGKSFFDLILTHGYEPQIKRLRELKYASVELKATQAMVLQWENLASVRQLGTNVAQKFINPVGFVTANLTTPREYDSRGVDYFAAQKTVTESVATTWLGGDKTELALARNLHRRSRLCHRRFAQGRRLPPIDHPPPENHLAYRRNRNDAGRHQWVHRQLAKHPLERVSFQDEARQATRRTTAGALQSPTGQPDPHEFAFQRLSLIWNARHDHEPVVGRLDWIAFMTADSYCRVPEENRRKSFESFFTTNAGGVWTCLGPNINHDIVKKHRGKSRSTSKPAVDLPLL